MTALRLDAVWLQEKLKTGDALIAGRIASMCGIIDQTINDVRTLAFHLRPGVLDDLGLVDALELYTSDFERRTGITCVFEPAAMTTPSDTVATAAYRIAQEALTNVARHAGAGHVHVLMGKEPHRLILAVQDDGRGFDVNHLPEFEGLGLAGMRERAALAGGRLEIQSKAGHGTLVRFMVPLGEEAERDSRKSMASAVSNGTHFHGDA